MTPSEALELIDSVADGGLGAPDYAKAYGMVKGTLFRVELLESDLEAAAKDLPIPMPEPGTDMARLLSANVLLRRQNSIERGEAASEVDRLRKAIGAIRDALHQEHLRGTFRDTLWMPDEYARNSTVFEFIDTTLER